MAEINLGNKEAREKLTAKLFYQETGESGWRKISLRDYNHVPDVTHVTHMRPAKGYSYVDDEQVDSITWRFTGTVDSFDELMEALRAFATQQSDVTQASSSGNSTSFTSVELGKSYFIGALDVSNVTVEVSTVTKTEGTDYELDPASGMITIIDGGSINAGDTVDVTYDQAGLIKEKFTGLDKVLFEGKFRLYEFSQWDAKPLRRHTFAGRLHITDWPEQSGEFGQSTVQVTATDKPAIRKRHAA